MLRWLHLSDMHVAYANYINRNIRDSLIEYLEKLQLEIDVIFITGDIAYKAEYSKELKSYLKKISKATKCDFGNIFICVGNHDIKRSENRDFIVEGIRNKYLEKNNNLGEEEYGYLFKQGHELFNEKMKELLVNYSSQVHSFIEREEYTVTILNTCLFSYGKEDENNLYILDDKFYHVLADNREKRKSNKINFAIGHHSQEWLNSTQQRKFGIDLEKNNVDLYLCGHNHSFDMKELEDSKIRQFTSGSILAENNDEVCFLLGEFDQEKKEYKIQIHTNDSEYDFWQLECKYNRFKDGVFSEKLIRENQNKEIIKNSENNRGYISSIEYSSMIFQIEKKANHFIGYEEELEEAQRAIKRILDEEESGEILFYHARELYGKSYFCAKLAYDLGYTSNKLDLLEHGIIFVDGKTANDISRTLELIREQASEIVGYKIEFTDIFRNNEEDYFTLTEEKKIEQILFELSKNNKKTLIIIDGLNEINSKAKSFFPKFLPPGICFLVTSNSKDKSFSNRTELKGFKEKEIRKILECNDTKFINDVLKKTKGCPMLIYDVKESLEEAEGDVKKVTIKVSGKDYFKNKVSEWRENPILNNLVELFSVFGYVSSLTLDQLQAYLNENVEFENITGKQILDALNLVENQLLITRKNEKNIYKAYYSLFVDQINQEKTNKDLAKKVESIMRCMLNNQDIFESEIVVKFFAYWMIHINEERSGFLMEILIALESEKKYSELEEIAIRMVLYKKTINKSTVAYFESKCDVIDREGIYHILCYLYSNKEYTYKSKDKLIKLLKYLTYKKNYIWAKHILSLEILDDDEGGNREEGERLLREAAESGNLQAKVNLGDRLLDGHNIKQNKEEGERLLREAAESGNLQAKNNLGSRLLDGHNMKQNKREGERLLRENAESGNLYAKCDFGDRLLDGHNIKQNKEEGERLLREAAKGGNLTAKSYLGSKLLDGHNMKQNKEEGERLLREAAKEGNLYAKYNLGNRLLDQENIEQNKEEGIRLLREAAEGNLTAKSYLGSRLLDGDNIKQNKEEGERLLWEAVAEGSLTAKGNLGIRLLDGVNIKQNKKEGERLLWEAAEGGNFTAKGNLGVKLLDGDNIKQNKKEGERLLREAVEGGNLTAKGNLGIRLLDGDNIKQNKKEGERLLREAVEGGNLTAKGNLGIRLLDGDSIKQNKKEGERLLREAAEEENLTAKGNLGIRLLDGHNIRQNKKEGERLLREAAEGGNHAANIYLGSRLLDGHNIRQNKKEGERLLRKAAEEGNVFAMHKLGYYLYNENNSKQAMYFFYKTVENSDESGEVNLAYIMRKEHITIYKGKTIETLLSRHVFKEKPQIMATINYVLYKIQDNEDRKEWINANNELLMKLKIYKEEEFKDAITWWNDNLSKNGDLEGDLVIGWLCKLGLISEIDGLSYLDRFNKVLAGGGFIIDWLYN